MIFNEHTASKKFIGVVRIKEVKNLPIQTVKLLPDVLF